MSLIADEIVTKVPAVTLGFWIIKIAATTLGETGGDTVTMTMNLGYLIGTAIFLAILVGLIVFQIAAREFHPALYWATIVASTTAGTTMADFADRSLGIGYTGGSLLLLGCVLAVLAVWHWSEGSVSVATVRTPLELWRPPTIGPKSRASYYSGRRSFLQGRWEQPWEIFSTNP
jgi:uncharacterized membrane-anchored protein